jgi:hypothetical protein
VQSDAVFGAEARVEGFDFGVNGSWNVEHYVVQTDKRGFADCLKDVVENHAPKTFLEVSKQVKSGAKVVRKRLWEPILFFFSNFTKNSLFMISKNKISAYLRAPFWNNHLFSCTGPH